MNKIYNDAKDKNVATTLVYADKADGKLFADEGKTEGIGKDDLFDLYLKGMIVKLDAAYLMPIMYTTSGSGAQVVAYNGTAAQTFNSSEIVASDDED